jgi:hypothetical protein
MMAMGFFIRDQMKNDSALVETDFRTVNHGKGVKEGSNPALHIRRPPAVNPSFGKLSLKRGVFPMREVSSRDNIQMAIEDERSATSSPSFLSDEVPSAFWRENGFDSETHL